MHSAGGIKEFGKNGKNKKSKQVNLQPQSRGLDRTKILPASRRVSRAINSRSNVEKWPRKCSTECFVRVKAAAERRPSGGRATPLTGRARIPQERAGGKRSDRYDLLPAANSVSPAARANCVCVHPSFSLSRLTGRRGTPPLAPLRSVPRHLSK